MRSQAGTRVVGVDPWREPDVVEGERALEAGDVSRRRVDGRIDLEERDAHDGGAGRPALEVERHAAVGANVPGAGDEDRTVSLALPDERLRHPRVARPLDVHHPLERGALHGAAVRLFELTPDRVPCLWAEGLLEESHCGTVEGATLERKVDIQW